MSAMRVQVRPGDGQCEATVIQGPSGGQNIGDREERTDGRVSGCAGVPLGDPTPRPFSHSCPTCWAGTPVSSPSTDTLTQRPRAPPEIVPKVLCVLFSFPRKQGVHGFHQIP